MLWLPTIESGVAITPHYRKYNVPEEDVEIISLTADELQLLINAVITDPRLDEARDIFLFGCFTGARYSDVSACQPDDIRCTVWHLHMHKTRSAIQIDLNSMARSIIAKYQDRGSGYRASATSTSTDCSRNSDVRSALTSPCASLVTGARARKRCVVQSGNSFPRTWLERLS